MQNATQEETHVDAQDSNPSPLGTLGLSAAVIATAIGLFYYFVQFEASGAVRGGKLWWPLAIAYNLGGKWPPTLMLWAFGVAGLALSAYEFTSARKKT